MVKNFLGFCLKSYISFWISDEVSFKLLYRVGSRMNFPAVPSPFWTESMRVLNFVTPVRKSLYSRSSRTAVCQACLRRGRCRSLMFSNFAVRLSIRLYSGRIVHEFADGSVVRFRSSRPADRCDPRSRDLFVDCIIRYQSAHGARSAARVADEGVEFASRRCWRCRKSLCRSEIYQACLRRDRCGRAIFLKSSLSTWKLAMKSFVP